MILSVLLSLAGVTAMKQISELPDYASKGYMGNFVSKETGLDSLQLNLVFDKLDVPKVSPLHGWSFDFVTAGYVKLSATDSLHLRFQTFTQVRKGDPKYDISQWGTRMLLRMWDMAHSRLRLDHNSLDTAPMVVDVYLCQDGEPGGEQTLDHDPKGSDHRVNTIYLYRIGQFPNQLEMAREFAHEYGHAVLPRVRGYDAPEDYANGQVGERLFLKWYNDSYKAGHLVQDDCVGASTEEVTRYVDGTVTPMVKRIATNGPDIQLLKGRSEKSFYEYVATVMYAEAELPTLGFRRAMLGNLGEHGDAFERQVEVAASELSSWNPKPVAGVKGPFYIPLGHGRLTGARVVARRGAWAKIDPTGGTILVKNPPIQ